MRTAAAVVADLLDVAPALHPVLAHILAIGMALHLVAMQTVLILAQVAAVLPEVPVVLADLGAHGGGGRAVAGGLGPGRNHYSLT